MGIDGVSIDPHCDQPGGNERGIPIAWRVEQVTRRWGRIVPRQRLIRFESKSRGPLSVCFLPPLIYATSIVYHRLHSSTTWKGDFSSAKQGNGGVQCGRRNNKGPSAVGRKTVKNENLPTNINQQGRVLCARASHVTLVNYRSREALASLKKENDFLLYY